MYIYGICPDLQYTYTHSPEGVEFLDLYVYVAENFVHTINCSQRKVTTTAIPTSCHKEHFVKNIPYGV